MKFTIKNTKWIVQTAILTFILAITISFISEMIMRNVNIMIAFLVLIFIIFVGIFFDTIGIAVTAADMSPFNAMASRKVVHASYAVKLVKNASQVSNFCNDVIGDIAGIISGAAISIIIILILGDQASETNTLYSSILFSGLVASMTVGGKALGKEIAINNWKTIINGVAKFLHLLDHRFHMKILK